VGGFHQQNRKGLAFLGHDATAVFGCFAKWRPRSVVCPDIPCMFIKNNNASYSSNATNRARSGGNVVGGSVGQTGWKAKG